MFWLRKKNWYTLLIKGLIVPYFSQILMNTLLIYAIIVIKHGFSIHKCLPGPSREVKNLRLLVFNISLWTWRTVMHEKTCLNPIIMELTIDVNNPVLTIIISQLVDLMVDC